MTKNNINLLILRKKKLDLIKSKKITRNITLTPTPTGNPQVDLVVCSMIAVSLLVYNCYFNATVSDAPIVEDINQHAIDHIKVLKEYVAVGERMHNIMVIMLPMLEANLPVDDNFLPTNDILRPAVEALSNFMSNFENLDATSIQLLDSPLNLEIREQLAEIYDSAWDMQSMLGWDLSKIEAPIYTREHFPILF